MSCLILRVYDAETSRSRRLLRVTVPDSRLLKWPWPPLRFKSLPLPVTFMRLETVLEVFCFIWIVLGFASHNGRDVAAGPSDGLLDGKLVREPDLV